MRQFNQVIEKCWNILEWIQFNWIVSKRRVRQEACLIQETLMKMFNMIDIIERAGSGIPSIYAVWRQQKWTAPMIIETFDPARTTMILPLHKESDRLIILLY